MKKILFLFSMLSIFASCSSIEKEIELLPIDYLTAGNYKIWQLKSYTVNGVDQLSDCLRDDTFIFNKKIGTYDWKKGDVLCSDADTDISFNFSLSQDGTIMTINEYDYKVNKLDIKNLELEITLNGHVQILTYSIIE
ncbi:hypothetical protein EGI22_02565 [Lacihabitans sp. LS3-19]|uniref:lipocalin family protein n=1 Tax=Lacihabitans sp. LS3-19 TaxID=2487335 RepID=UPI0020CC636A|nr:lipocalin family protein [Lacihabitans sp. LS3-19]MCP9766774.1 hypothetical protein [Lacihabitans sp. LS3-19]